MSTFLLQATRSILVEGGGGQWLQAGVRACVSASARASVRACACAGLCACVCVHVRVWVSACLRAGLRVWWYACVHTSAIRGAWLHYGCVCACGRTCLRAYMYMCLRACMPTDPNLKKAAPNLFFDFAGTTLHRGHLQLPTSPQTGLHTISCNLHVVD